MVKQLVCVAPDGSWFDHKPAWICYINDFGSFNAIIGLGPEFWGREVLTEL